jgi:zinc transport system substrate-binding protein
MVRNLFASVKLITTTMSVWKGANMNRQFTMSLLFVFILFALLGNCFAAGKLPVFVSIVPQKYFVQQIGKDLVDVQAMVLPGTSPATYEPKPKQMADLSNTKVYFAIGVPFENAWLEKSPLPIPTCMWSIRTMVSKSSPWRLTTIMMTMHEGEHHGEAERDHDDHEHAGLDPHIWLSPPLVKIQARTILAALQEADPAHRSVYEANFKVFTAQIDNWTPI